MNTHPPHPSLLPAAPTPGPHPHDLRVHLERITVDTLTVTDPRNVLAHARRAARNDPDTAALLGHGPLSLPAAAALLCALHDDPDELTSMGLRPAGHATCISAARVGDDPVILELSDQAAASPSTPPYSTSCMAGSPGPRR
ncbi:hypothetical protein [Streptomyces sp. NPDC053720]|uniref:hypothetical protein n=1 Tax=Streptomyces sp. NPDC053720 TaxID=3154855 RepID=UPI00343FF911